MVALPKRKRKLKHKRTRKTYENRGDRFGHHLDYMTQVLRKAEGYSERRVSLRPSSFPICARMVALHNLRELTTDGMVLGVDKFVSQPYFAVGTVLHEVYQSWLGRIGAIYGIWKCPYVRSLVKNDGPGGRIYEERMHCNFTVEQWGTMQCPRCAAEGRDKWLLYDEYYLQPVKAHVGLYSGSTDGAMYLGDGTHAYPIPRGSNLEPDTVLELKSTSQADFATRKEPKSYGHIEQASAYAQMLRTLKGWDIKNIVYGYVNRNHPWQVKFFRHSILPDGVVDRNAFRYHIGRQYPRGIKRIPNGSCSTIDDATGFRWWGMAWMGCPDAATCFGGDGCGGLNAGESVPWVERALQKLVQIEG